MAQTLKLSQIRIDGGTQPRAKIDTSVVDEYAERLLAGDDFPLVDVFFDGKDHWLADGFHRYHGYAKAGKKSIPATIRKGTVRDAILFSVGANSHHGLRRSNADKRGAVMKLLEDEEWAQRSNRWIAEQCAVSDMLVADARNQLQDSCSSNEPATRTSKDGKQRPASQPPRVTPVERRVPVEASDEPENEAPEAADDSPPEPQSDEKPLKNGSQVKNSADKREALKVYGSLVRWTDRLKIHDRVRPEMETILAAIKGA